jgi:3D (Asp-Asp-Asp) domain-containing protein
MKFLFGGGASVTGALLAGSFLIFVPTSIAEPLQEPTLQKKGGPSQLTQESQPPLDARDELSTGATVSNVETVNKVETVAAPANESTESTITNNPDIPAAPPEKYTATAYSLYGRTASGSHVRKGMIAADRRVLPIGTKVRLEAGSYSGEYEVCDTGSAVRGKKVDVWVPSSREAMRFGRRNIKLTVLSYPKNHVSRQKAAAKK